MAELSNQDNTKFLEEREKKLRQQIKKVETKQEIEMNAFNAKKNTSHTKFNKDRALEFDQ
jgi:hypothetical protein